MGSAHLVVDSSIGGLEGAIVRERDPYYFVSIGGIHFELHVFAFKEEREALIHILGSCTAQHYSGALGSSHHGHYNVRHGTIYWSEGDTHRLFARQI
jgi:hypothetical protein